MIGGKRIGLAAVAAIAVFGCIVLTAAASPARRTGGAPAAHGRATAATAGIGHVWVIPLEDHSYSQTFGDPAADPYLARTLVSKGALLERYYAIGHDSLDNYVAMISGQAPNFQTGQDCEYFSRFYAFDGENYNGFTRYGQLSGDGCVYPDHLPRYSVQTVANQLTAHHLSWRAYEEDMGNDPQRDGTVMTPSGPACGHPYVGAIDLTDITAPADDSYATRHDPFMYFKSVIKPRAYCAKHVGTLAPLARDLRSQATTPRFSFVTPNTCHDAHDIPRCQDGERGGLRQSDAWLARWIPRIMRSPAYRANGLIVVLFDESGTDDDAGACCGERVSNGLTDPSHPNTNEPGLYGPGGGRVGAVLLSPRIAPGTVSTRPYNHYSLLRSIEDVFGLSHLGDANQPQVHSFGTDVFTSG